MMLKTRAEPLGLMRRTAAQNLINCSVDHYSRDITTGHIEISLEMNLQ